MNWYFVAWHWVEIHTGVLPLKPSRAYNFWSGFGSDLGEVTILGAVVAGYRKMNCHSKGCWRIAHHEIDRNGVKYKVCRKCHPDVDHENRLRREHFAHPAGQKRDARGRFTK